MRAALKPDATPLSTHFDLSLVLDHFHQADWSLLFAITAGDDAAIRRASQDQACAFDALMGVIPETPAERGHLARFLAERFMLSENVGPEQQLRALQKLVELAARPLLHQDLSDR
ncbi:MAG: hypothetical protein OXR62_05560 [Ahrensia sp.]|nr:hypothetical protein [Ahrensia sp.]